ncbi:MAG: hypothetical protein ACT4P8_00225 [Betaproteobacteria bacterium]
MNRALAFTMAAFPFALAAALYSTGLLERINTAIDSKLDRKRYKLETPRPGRTRPLAEYAGWWQRDAIPHYGTEWVARIIVRTEGKRAWLRMWHECRPNYCEQGEFEADVYGRPPGEVYAIEVVRKKGPQVLWVVTLRPNAHHPNLLITESRRARDPQRNPHDNQSAVTALTRVR